MNDLLAALGLGRGEVVALCGAGGKSTLARALRDASLASGRRVVLTATTHCGVLGDTLTLTAGAGEAAVADALERLGAVQVVAAVGERGRARGLVPEAVGSLAALADLVIAEADGARGRRLKAPADHEPLLPRPCTTVLAVCSLAALGGPLDDEGVHRLERVLALAGRRRGDAIDLDVLAAAFGPGGYGSVGEQARRVLFVVEAGAPPERAVALCARLAGHYERVVAGDALRGAVRTLSSNRC
ncbi:MAG: putative selenium-dependent hydroxylase accessory protein YqeC [Vicinamibacteria bacterium]|nr:putative selenium-dependent hydroxylase accessory protein YqeC [Vicinamibacteria bacterium]